MRGKACLEKAEVGMNPRRFGWLRRSRSGIRCSNAVGTQLPVPAEHHVPLVSRIEAVLLNELNCLVTDARNVQRCFPDLSQNANAVRKI